jgi:hypothetical protein
VITYTSKNHAARSLFFDLAARADGFVGTLEDAADEVTQVGRKGIAGGKMQVARRRGQGSFGWLDADEFHVPRHELHNLVLSWRSPDHIEEYGWTVAYIGRKGESRWVIEEAEATYVGPGSRRRRDDLTHDLGRVKAALEFSLDRTDGRSTLGKRYSKALAGIDVAITALVESDPA